MELGLLLILVFVSLIIYSTLQRSVADVTTTPVWLLWLVLMIPAWLWTVWGLVYPDQFPPLLPVILSFVLCPLLFWGLVQRGRIPAKAKQDSSSPTPRQSAPQSELEPPVRPITPDEEEALKNCFPWDLYYLQKIDYRPQAILCRGKLRSISEEAYEKIRHNIERLFGDRFLILFQESFQGQPFFALVPNPWAKANQKSAQSSVAPATFRPGSALTLLLITLFTTTVIGAEMAGISPEQMQQDASLLIAGFPYSLGLIAIIGCHELSHYITAVAYKIRTTLPYFIPIPFFLGTFGAFIQMRSPVPHRKALFDIAIAGPLGGLLVTLPVLIWGLSLSETVPLPEESHVFEFQSLDPRFSFLLAILSKLALGSDFASGTAIALHPLAIAGYIGLIITALNLMPVGQLDGGHIVHGMFGQRTAMAIGWISRWLILLLGMLQPIFFLWAILLFFMPIVDQPTLNDVTELNNTRDALGLFALALLVIIIIPVPQTLAQWLQF